MKINSAFHGRPIVCVRHGQNRLPVGVNHLRQLETQAGSTRAESPASSRLEIDRRQAPFRERESAPTPSFRVAAASRRGVVGMCDNEIGAAH